MKYKKKDIFASGNVVVRNKDLTVYANNLFYSAKDRYLKAKGNIIVEKNNNTFSATIITYDIKNENIFFRMLTSTINTDLATTPVYLKSSEFDIKKDSYSGNDCAFTTCKGNKDYYLVKARKFLYLPKDKIAGYDITLYSSGVPVLISPYYEFYLKARNPMFLMPVVGSNRVEGGYMKNDIEYSFNSDNQNTFFIDLLETKGLALGLHSKLFSERNVPLDFFFYEAGEGNYYTKLSQMISLDNWAFDYSLNRKNFYNLWGYRDNYFDSSLSFKNKAEKYSFSRRYNLIYNITQQEAVYSNNLNNTNQDIRLAQDYYGQSNMVSDYFHYKYKNATTDSAFIYQNTDYKSQQNYNRFIKYFFKYNLDRHLELETNLDYKNILSNQYELNNLAPQFVLLYKADEANNYISSLQLNMNTNINLGKTSSYGAISQDLKENLPEVKIVFRKFYPQKDSYLAPLLTLGNYYERKNTGTIYQIQASRLLFSNTYYQNMWRNNLLNIDYYNNFNQYLYSTNDKQYSLGHILDCKLSPLPGVNENIIYEVFNVYGYTPFYFDEIKTAQNKITSRLNYKISQAIIMGIEDSFSFLEKKRSPQQYKAILRANDTQELSLLSSYDYDAGQWGNLNAKLFYQLDNEHYVIINSVYNLRKGEIEDSNMQFAWQIADKEGKWIVVSEFLWNNQQKLYRIPKLRISRNLGCVEYSYEYNDYLREHTFMFYVTAFENGKAGVSAGSAGVSIRGFMQREMGR